MVLLETTAILSAALIDSVNPCTFAIFFFLMGNLVQTKNKKRMIAGSISFITAIFISYALIGVGLVNTYEVIGLKKIFYYITGGLAIIIGLANLRSYVKQKNTGCKYNSRLQQIISKTTNVKTMFITGIICSLFLLPCTAGPYVVITSIISQSTTISYLSWIFIYNTIFVMPLILISFLTIKGIGYKFQKWQLEKQQKIDLVSGLLMIVIGLSLIIYNLLSVATCTV